MEWSPHRQEVGVAHLPAAVEEEGLGAGLQCCTEEPTVAGRRMIPEALWGHGLALQLVAAVGVESSPSPICLCR